MGSEVEQGTRFDKGFCGIQMSVPDGVVQCRQPVVRSLRIDFEGGRTSARSVFGQKPDNIGSSEKACLMNRRSLHQADYPANVGTGIKKRLDNIDMSFPNREPERGIVVVPTSRDRQTLIDWLARCK